MRNEAETHAAEDKKRRELVDVRNQAESMCYQVEKTIKEHEAKIDPGVKSEIETRLGELRAKVQSEDSQAMKDGIAALEKAMHKASESIYKSQGAEAGGADDGGEKAGARAGGGGDEEIKDADFEVK
jgi:molecular chaperone DnaK